MFTILFFLQTYLILVLISKGYTITDTDYQPMLGVVKSLVQKYIRPDNETGEDQFNEIVKKLLLLMLCIVDGVVSPSGPSAISGLLSDWASVFELRNKK